MKELGIVVDFKVEITLQVIPSTIPKNASTLRVQKLKNISAKEPINTHAKGAIWMLDAKYKKTDLQSIVKDNCKHLKRQSSRSYCSFSLMSRFLMAP